ncbi:stage V sporulation protein AB [Lachnospiraceae bacterium 38-10]
MIQNSGVYLFLAVYGVSAGLLVSAGIFTVLLAVGLTPRFVGTTHTARKILLYEGCITAGAVIGTIFSAIPVMGQAGKWLREQLFSEKMVKALDIGGEVFLGIAGLFIGMFVGCLALAIAEMLDSIPIFARRVSYRHGLGIAVLAVAIGKLLGSLYYFWQGGICPG